VVWPTLGSWTAKEQNGKGGHRGLDHVRTMQPHLVDDSVDVDRRLIMQLVHQCVDCDVRPGSTDSGADTHDTTATTLSADNATLLAFAAERRPCRLHKRKLLLGPGAQAPPHFYDHGLAYITSPPLL